MQWMTASQNASSSPLPEDLPPTETRLATAEPLQAIVYTSVAVMPLMVAVLERLHRRAVEWNLQHGITGVLLYDGGQFMQYLEGPQPALGQLYARIRTDTRHHRVVNLLDAPIAQRNFAQWHMGLAQATQSEVLSLSTASWQQLHDAPQGGSGESPGLTLLLAFWRRKFR